jgi:DNA processing protein
MSDPRPTVINMKDLRLVAVALAALELLPAEPSDLAGLLEAPVQREALLRLTSDDQSTDLTAYLCGELDLGRIRQWQKNLELVSDSGVEALISGSDGYPRLLQECWDRPPLLFLHGHLEPTRPALAIVGSRSASEDTLSATLAVARTAAKRGISVVSGLATGVDTLAHSGALEASGHTVAVLGTGITRVFPETNIELAATIADAGALVSQFEPRAPKTPTTFLRRNSLIASMSHASLVMDGQERSGSRHQAEQAVRYERPVMFWEPALRTQPWAVSLVQAGAATFVKSAEDVFQVLRTAA